MKSTVFLQFVFYVRKKLQNDVQRHIYTERKVSIFGVFVVLIFPHSDWIRRDTLRIQSEYGKIRIRKIPNTDPFHAVLRTQSNIAGLRPANLLKKRLWHRCFPVNFAKFLRTSSFIEHLWWLLLCMIKIRVSYYIMLQWKAYRLKKYFQVLRKSSVVELIRVTLQSAGSGLWSIVSWLQSLVIFWNF